MHNHAMKEKMKYQGPRQQGDTEVERAIQLWSETFHWPRWFAKNVVLWRKDHRLEWRSCAGY